LADCENTVAWFWAKFAELMAQDNLVGLPAAARLGVIWGKSCKVEDQKVHIYITEFGVSTPEEDGPPCFIFYAPRATLKLRCESIEVALRAVTMCYSQDPTLEERHKHHTKEWDLIARIFGGTVDEKHRVQLDRRIETDVAAAWNKETFVAWLATEPYRAGIGKFASQFKPDAPYSATFAIERGVHDGHGPAIFFEQGNRRCLLTRRHYGISDEYTFWKS
jgi:hypothetical protein